MIIEASSKRPLEIFITVSGGVHVTVLMSKGNAVAFRLRYSGNVVCCRLANGHRLPATYASSYNDGIVLDEREFRRRLRLALRQVI